MGVTQFELGSHLNSILLRFTSGLHNSQALSNSHTHLGSVVYVMKLVSGHLT